MTLRFQEGEYITTIDSAYKAFIHHPIRLPFQSPSVPPSYLGLYIFSLAIEYSPSLYLNPPLDSHTPLRRPLQT